MKKTILFAVIIIFLALIIPGTPVFADIGMGGRIDAGLDLFAFPASEPSIDDEMSVMPVIPLIDAGFYGQFNLGMVNFGLGFRAFSLIIFNVFSPSIYAELNLWRFSLNAQITGGALYIFPLYLVAGPYFFPELSLWYTLNNRKNQLRIGVGTITLLSPWNVNQEYIEDSYNYLRDFYNNMVFYLSFKIVFPSSWVEW
jgi:hypothetical protein